MSETPEQPDAGAQAPAPQDSSWRTLRRRAGCIAGCLTEPLVIVGLMIGSLVGGFLWGRKSVQKPTPEEPEGTQDD